MHHVFWYKKIVTIHPILTVVKKDKDNPLTAFVSTEVTRLFLLLLKRPPQRDPR